MDRVFLDANVLFSAASTPDSGLRALWSLAGVDLVTSEFAPEEARRNLLVHQPGSIAALDELSARVSVTSGIPAKSVLPRGIAIADKDRPILAAAVAALCTHLLTGDTRHFGSLYGRKVQGVLIVTPAQYLRKREGRR